MPLRGSIEPSDRKSDGLCFTAAVREAVSAHTGAKTTAHGTLIAEATAAVSVVVVVPVAAVLAVVVSMAMMTAMASVVTARKIASKVLCLEPLRTGFAGAVVDFNGDFDVCSIARLGVIFLTAGARLYVHADVISVNGCRRVWMGNLEM